jgi:hypothetical protein
VISWILEPRFKKSQSRGKKEDATRAFRRSVCVNIENRAEQLGMSPHVGTVRAPRERTDVSDLHLLRRSFQRKIATVPQYYYEMVLSSDVFAVHFMDLLASCLDLSHRGHWTEALKVSYKSSLPQALTRYFSPQEWDVLDWRLQAGKAEPGDVEFAAWLILFDIWVWTMHGYDKVGESPISSIATAARGLRHPVTDLALSIRDACHGARNDDKNIRGIFYNKSPTILTLLSEAGWLGPNKSLQRQIKTK